LHFYWSAGEFGSVDAANQVLAAYFLQYGVSSDTKPSKSKAEVTLQFPKGIDRSYIESVLNGYKKQFLGLSASS
jgi:hypothetical protein